MKRLIITLTLVAAAASAPFAIAADGEAVFKKTCFACHDTGAAGAPKRGDATAWAPRIAKGIDALVMSVTNGLNAMPPRGTCATCSDDELRAAVEYLVAQAKEGATAQPAAPAPAPAAAQPAAEAQPTPSAETKPEAAAALTPGDAAAGKAKAPICAACHGLDGNSVNPVWPKLAGQSPGYIVKQLHALKDGARTNELMSPMAQTLSDQDMLDVAAYFSAQTPSDSQGNAALLDAGMKVYTRGNLANGVVACAGCHGPDGLGNPAAGFPRLAKQHAAYVVKALKDFRAGTRTNDLNGIMQGVAGKMTDDEIAAVAEYVTNLK